MSQKILQAPTEYVDDMGGAQAPSMDLWAVLASVMRRWKLVTFIALSALIATTIVVKLVVPSRFKSTVEILVYDPQRQTDTTFQKPLSPFVDAIGSDAMSTEIHILKSKSVALRVASELGLDTDPEFQSGGFRVTNLAKPLRIADWAKRLGIADWAKRLGIADLGKRLGFPGVDQDYNVDQKIVSGADEKAEGLDRAADQLIGSLDIWQESYIIFVSATARDPAKARRLASTVADEYLAIQREARREALEHVAAWLKSRMDNLQSRVSETEALIEKLKVESGIHDIELDAARDAAREQQIRDLESQLTIARQELKDRSAYIEQARRVIDSHGDIGTIPEITIMSPLSFHQELSAPGPLTVLRQRKMELNFTLADLQNRLGEHSPQLVSIRAEQRELDKQMEAEADKIVVNMKNAYDLGVRRVQSLEANLQSLAANRNSEEYTRLRQLRHTVDENRKDYEIYLAQYNDVSERLEEQFASARIVSPATLPRSPTSGRVKFYALGGMAGLGVGLLLAFLLEFLRQGVRTDSEIEQTFGLPVVGIVPLVSQREKRGKLSHQPLLKKANEPFSHLREAVQFMRASLELSSAGQKVILITSALPGEGKSTAAMLLAASSAGSGKRAILVDCDLRRRSISEALRRKPLPGLSELLRGSAQLKDVVSEDPVTKISVISAGSVAPDATDLLMSKGMLDLISTLRCSFDYVVMDGPPLLPVVDALALATIADKILMIVEWDRTPRACVSEALKVLAPEADRVAGVVLNKVNFRELPRYRYRSIAKYYSKG